MAKAKDIMRTDIICVEPDTPIKIAFKLMKNRKICSIPVLHYDGSVAGVLSEKDLLGLFKADGGQQGQTLTSNLMTWGIITADENDDIGTIIDCLCKNHFRQIPVVSNGKYVGMVGRKEVLAKLADIPIKI
ncbi:MAG: CBS domain-containing protein [Anaerohalosphaeraceae bacterium]|nr:CBS domain-containing protein [Anaerohalosphaeraceae bacterium]